MGKLLEVVDLQKRFELHILNEKGNGQLRATRPIFYCT